MLNLVAREGGEHRRAIVHAITEERPDATLCDPAAYSFAHGGKDGHAHPVDRETYDATIEFLEGAVRRARIGDVDCLHALRRLQSLNSERGAPSELED